MENEELLPKPQTDLPLPEKEISEHATPASQGLALRSYGRIFKSKFFLGFVAFSALVAFLIGGFYLGKNQNNKQAYQTPTQTMTPTPDPTADWKTYTNTDLGFSFKYPPESKLTFNCLECEAPDLMISFPNDTYTLISAGSTEKIDKEKPTVKAIIDDKIYVNKFSTYPVTVTRSAYTLDGIEGEKTFSEEKIGNLTRNDIDILVLKDKKLYTFNFRFRPENKQKMSILADQMLSTFKFTN